MMLYIYTKFHENVPKGFSVIERTRNHDVWTDGHTDGRTDKVISIDRQTPPELLMDGWMDDMQFYVLFNSISVISGRWKVDNERLCSMKLRLPELLNGHDIMTKIYKEA